MKHSLMTITLIGLLGALPVMYWSPALQAGNSSVEAGLESFGDVSMFYQALLNTGVINDLNENQTYTIFAPVNSAWAQVPRSAYPCFYSEQCRPQIAGLLRDHIIPGRHDLSELVSYGGGIRTNGLMRVRVEEPYIREYAVDNHRILSRSEIGGNIIYRIDGVITTPQELAQFRTTDTVPVADTVTEKTTVRKTYRSPSSLPEAYPAGSMPGSPEGPAANESETTTVIDTYTGPAQ